MAEQTKLIDNLNRIILDFSQQRWASIQNICQPSTGHDRLSENSLLGHVVNKRSEEIKKRQTRLRSVRTEAITIVSRSVRINEIIGFFYNKI